MNGIFQTRPSITNTNDTTESKLKMSFDKPMDMDDTTFNSATKKIMDYFYSFSPNIKLLCFSMDSSINSKIRKQNNNFLNRYYDYSGRGFALPRMWAQYANNNTGVCFIFNKQKILDKLSHISRHYELDVDYKPFTERFNIDGQTVNSLYEKIECNNNGRLTFYDYINNYRGKKIPPYIKYNFFQKLNDWANEQEYRILDENFR